MPALSDYKSFLLLPPYYKPFLLLSDYKSERAGFRIKIILPLHKVRYHINFHLLSDIDCCFFQLLHMAYRVY